MKYRKIAIALVATLGLSLTACGGADSGGGSNNDVTAQAGDAPMDNDTPPPVNGGGPGTYKGVVDDTWTRITVQIPAPKNPIISRVEKYRAAAGAPPATYALVTFDNRKGRAEQETWDGLMVVTDAGHTVVMKHIATDGGVLAQIATTNRYDNSPLWQQAYNWYGTFFDHQSVLPGATETVVVATTHPIPSIKSVFADTDEFGGTIQLTKQ